MSTYIYINIKWEENMYTYTSCKLGDIYTRMHIYIYVRVCVCVYMHICIPARCPRSRASERDNLHFGSAVPRSFCEILHRWRRNLPKFWSQMTKPMLINDAADDENRPEARKARHRSEINLRSISRRRLRELSFLTLQQSRLRLLTDNED